MSTATEKAKALAAELRAVFKKHRVSSSTVWVETDPGVVIFTATIKTPEAKTIADASK